jgi:hypothetical protein
MLYYWASIEINYWKLENMKKIYGIAGENARFVGLLSVFLPMFAAIFIAGYIIGVASPVKNLSTTIIGILLLCLALAFGISIVLSRKKLSLYYKGAKGEEDVATELTKLSDDYVIFNDFSPQIANIFKPQKNIDHIVVGASGIFIIETKNWSADISLEKGQILYNGKMPDTPPLQQARELTKLTKEWLEDQLDEDIDLAYHPVVCFASNQIKDSNIYVSGVQVCNLTALTDCIENALVIPIKEELLEKVVQCFVDYFEAP